MSTAHYRQARYEQAGEPDPFFRIWVRLLCAAGCASTRRAGPAAATSTWSPGACASGRPRPTPGVRSVQLTPDTVADLERYLQMTAERPADGPLLPTRNGTLLQPQRTRAKRIIKPLVAETNVVLAERGQPALPDGVTAHALRKTYFTFLHEAGAPPRWVADQGGHADPSTSLRIYTEVAARPRAQRDTARRSTRWSTESHLPTGALNPGDDDSA